MFYVLNNIVKATSKGTEATLAVVEYFLNYAASNPDKYHRETSSRGVVILFVVNRRFTIVDYVATCYLVEDVAHVLLRLIAVVPSRY